MIGKKGQVTILIIAAIIIVAAVAFYFLIRSDVVPGIPGLGDGKEANPNSFLDSCLEDKLTQTIKTISHQGGYLEPELKKTFMFQEEGIAYDLTYLCYFELYYEQCINQKPNIMQDLKEQIKEEIRSDVSSCWNDLGLSLEEEGYTVNAEYKGFEVDILPSNLKINIEGKLVLTKANEISTKEDLKLVFPTKLYDITVVAKEIVNQEARFCNFEYQGYMIENPEFYIDKFTTSDATIIYTVEHKKSNEWFRFAIRGCVIPPGF